jgi:hypothetical protein
MIEQEQVIRRTRVDNAAYVIGQLRALGLEPHPASRLMRMHRVLSRGHVPHNDPEFPVALEAERDLQQLGFIFDQGADTGCPVFRRLVHDLIGDPALPQDGLDHSPGRNAQFELYLGAVCRRGMLAVTHAEPDIRCIVAGKPFGIAAKRIKNCMQVKGERQKGGRADSPIGCPGYHRPGDVTGLEPPEHAGHFPDAGPATPDVRRASWDAVLQRARAGNSALGRRQGCTRGRDVQLPCAAQARNPLGHGGYDELADDG